MTNQSPFTVGTFPYWHIGPLYLGQLKQNGFIGDIDEVVVFNRRLTPHEIDQIRAGTYATTSSTKLQIDVTEFVMTKDFSVASGGTHGVLQFIVLKAVH
jgi:hypothetical protein